MRPSVTAGAPMIDSLLGLDLAPPQLTFGQMVARAFVVFIFGVILLRIGARRELGRNAGFDMLLLVVLGSVLSRAINGQSAFFPTLGVSLVLVLLHAGVSWFASRFHWLSRALKGRPVPLVSDGRTDRAALQKILMSPEDLDEALRLNGNVSDPSRVREARLERNGEISVVKRDPSD
jgi:uncharacterized membrane protein YcaP (DUF421 family)